MWKYLLCSLGSLVMCNVILNTYKARSSYAMKDKEEEEQKEEETSDLDIIPHDKEEEEQKEEETSDLDIIPHDKEEEEQKEEETSDLDIIPHDMTMEILSRLPLESLLTVQHVSKTWYSIIRSKDFINSSMAMSSRPSQLLISFKNGILSNNNPKKCLFFFTCEEKSLETSSLVANLDMTMTCMDSYFYTRCTSLNGFICLSHKGRFMICNPSTRQVITLPEIAGTRWKSTFKFLGYDPVGDQYKALCKRLSEFGEDQEHMVLTIGGYEKPSWRLIQVTTRNYDPKTKGICINGFVYYGALTAFAQRPVIVCFDVRSERLSFIELPWKTTYTGTRTWETTTIINYKGKLATITGGETSHAFDLWVLEDVKEHQWSTKSCWFPISLCYNSLGNMYFPGINKTGEIIIAPMYLRDIHKPFYILYYNVESREIRKVQVKGIADDEEFRRRYGIGNYGECHVYISPDYGGNISFI